MSGAREGGCRRCACRCAGRCGDLSAALEEVGGGYTAIAVFVKCLEGVSHVWVVLEEERRQLLSHRTNHVVSLSSHPARGGGEGENAINPRTSHRSDREGSVRPSSGCGSKSQPEHQLILQLRHTPSGPTNADSDCVCAGFTTSRGLLSPRRDSCLGVKIDCCIREHRATATTAGTSLAG
eukprot:SAG11_NODE_6443_length_1312_cov_1.593570_2_plen_180_part_00